MCVRSVASAIFAITISQVCFAQTSVPSGLRNKDAATSGRTDVASEGFEATGAKEESKDATELALNAGAFLAAGNSRSIAATFAEQFRLRRGDHQLSVTSGVNYGESAAGADAGLETTVENYQAKIRYDYFLSDGFAIFAGVSGRKDRFQGLALRLNVAPGAAYYFLDHKDHRLWTELGYALQHDIRTDAVVREAAAQGSDVSDTETRHFGRLFAGYSNELNDVVTFNSGVEFLLGISPFEDELSGRTNWRLGVTAGWTAKVSDKFSIATSITVDYDNNPLPDIRHTDATTAINLVYTLL